MREDAGIERVTFPSRDAGITLEGRLYPAGALMLRPPGLSEKFKWDPVKAPPADDATLARRGQALVVFSHGVLDTNASSMPRMLSAAGFRIFQYDYRGFGNSTKAEPTHPGMMQDAAAVLDYLRTRPDVQSDQLILVGHSLGGVYAMAMGAEAEKSGTPAAAVMTWATFSNYRIMANHFLPVLGFLAGGADGPMPTDLAAGLVKTPLMIVHPLDDDVVPRWHAEQLARSNWQAGGDAQLLITPRGKHVSSFLSFPSTFAPMLGWLDYQLDPQRPRDPRREEREETIESLMRALMREPQTPVE